MLLEATNLAKSIGAKYLFQDLAFTIVAGEKIALIGRNGYGKTTLFKILSGEDHDFEGTVTTRKGTRIVLTKQEHIQELEQSALEYILNSVPHYFEYQKFLEEYESGQNTNLNRYLEVLEYFTEHKYFNLREAVISSLEDFGISTVMVHQPLKHLSGGQKRYVEMTRMMFSQADILLIDEPTNHMDYKGKERFITWMRSILQAVVVITHDRDVLKNVTKIIELKDQKMHFFKGNYHSYIKQNATQTLTSVKLYEDQLSRLKEAKKKVEWGLQMRAKSKEWKIRYDHWLRDYEKIKAATIKPAFWIDQNSIESLDKKVVDSYDKFKEKNIKISGTGDVKRGGELVSVRQLAVGYDECLFSEINFSLKESGRVFIKGRNGAGKSTLVKTLIALSEKQPPTANLLDGEITFGNDLRIGEYQQEIDGKYLSLPLVEAIRVIHEEKKVAIDERKVYSLLAQYLFDTKLEAHQKIANLSGGQKARFQLIKMFIGEPNLLILDEPTNHLDLPSIEELETMLEDFPGAILYISHDTYFINRLGGDAIQL